MKKDAKLVVYRGRGWSLIRLKTSTNLYVIASEKGKPRLYESTGTGNITEAMRIGKEKYKLWLRTDTKPLGRSLLCDGWRLLKASRETAIEVGDLQKTTHRRTVDAWKRLESFWGGKLPQEITQDNWTNYKAEMNKKHGRPSLQPEFKTLNMVAHDMYLRGDAPKPPAIDIGKGNSKSLDPGRKIPELHLSTIWSLNKPEILQLFIGNGIFHGMRIEEVTCLEQANFYQDGNWYLKITKSKTGPRTIKVADILVPLFQRIKAQAPHRYFFPRTRGDKTGCSSTQLWDRLWREAVREPLGLDYVFHELRHTAISNAVAAKCNVGHVSRYFGVSLKVIDEVYLKLTEGETGECADVLVQL